MADGRTSPTKSPWFVGLGVLAVLAAGAALAFATRPPPPQSDAGEPRAIGFTRKIRPHFDHAPVMAEKFESPQAVTVACLKCHPDAASVMKSVHWLFVGQEVTVDGHDGAKVRIGKKNLLNNFCIATSGNEKTCMKCHAGYGWVDDTFDFSKQENVDCLVCHESSGTYFKGPGGLPTDKSDLAAAARSVGTPRRENCLVCHAYGGGGQAVKHGDLDSSLAHPFEEEDVHIGRHQFLCIDCHQATDHQLKGRAYTVSVDDSNAVSCTGCHVAPEHQDQRINLHLKAVACQTCHIPNYASKLPTKSWWDWSKAGDDEREEDPHSYLAIKGEFTYQQDALPAYRWFNGKVGRYLLGDKIDPKGVTAINPLRGDINDPTARIWPFKIHRAKQPYDAGFDYLFPPVTGGKGGYWWTFEWDSAFELGSKSSKIPYSGKYGFASTEMFFPLSHMVTPKAQALGCTDCHGDGKRLDWKALGYAGDPLETGGRK